MIQKPEMTLEDIDAYAWDKAYLITIDKLDPLEPGFNEERQYNYEVLFDELYEDGY